MSNVPRLQNVYTRNSRPPLHFQCVNLLNGREVRVDPGANDGMLFVGQLRDALARVLFCRPRDLALFVQPIDSLFDALLLNHNVLYIEADPYRNVGVVFFAILPASIAPYVESNDPAVRAYAVEVNGLVADTAVMAAWGPVVQQRKIDAARTGCLFDQRVFSVGEQRQLARAEEWVTQRIAEHWVRVQYIQEVFFKEDSLVSQPPPPYAPPTPPPAGAEESLEEAVNAAASNDAATAFASTNHLDAARHSQQQAPLSLATVDEPEEDCMSSIASAESTPVFLPSSAAEMNDASNGNKTPLVSGNAAGDRSWDSAVGERSPSVEAVDQVELFAPPPSSVIHDDDDDDDQLGIRSTVSSGESAVSSCSRGRREAVGAPPPPPPPTALRRSGRCCSTSSEADVQVHAPTSTVSETVGTLASVAPAASLASGGDTTEAPDGPRQSTDKQTPSERKSGSPEEVGDSKITRRPSRGHQLKPQQKSVPQQRHTKKNARGPKNTGQQKKTKGASTSSPVLSPQPSRSRSRQPCHRTQLHQQRHSGAPPSTETAPSTASSTRRGGATRQTRAKERATSRRNSPAADALLAEELRDTVSDPKVDFLVSLRHRAMDTRQVPCAHERLRKLEQLVHLLDDYTTETARGAFADHHLVALRHRFHALAVEQQTTRLVYAYHLCLQSTANLLQLLTEMDKVGQGIAAAAQPTDAGGPQQPREALVRRLLESSSKLPATLQKLECVHELMGEPLFLHSTECKLWMVALGHALGNTCGLLQQMQSILQLLTSVLEYDAERPERMADMIAKLRGAHDAMVRFCTSIQTSGLALGEQRQKYIVCLDNDRDRFLGLKYEPHGVFTSSCLRRTVTWKSDLQRDAFFAAFASATVWSLRMALVLLVSVPYGIQAELSTTISDEEDEEDHHDDGGEERDVEGIEIHDHITPSAQLVAACIRAARAMPEGDAIVQQCLEGLWAEAAVGLTFENDETPGLFRTFIGLPAEVPTATRRTHVKTTENKGYRGREQWHELLTAGALYPVHGVLDSLLAGMGLDDEVVLELVTDSHRKGSTTTENPEPCPTQPRNHPAKHDSSAHQADSTARTPSTSNTTPTSSDAH